MLKFDVQSILTVFSSSKMFWLIECRRLLKVVLIDSQTYNLPALVSIMESTGLAWNTRIALPWQVVKNGYLVFIFTSKTINIMNEDCCSIYFEECQNSSIVIVSFMRNEYEREEL